MLYLVHGRTLFCGDIKYARKNTRKWQRFWGRWPAGTRTKPWGGRFAAELPMVILFRLLMTGYAVFLLYAAWKVLTSGVFRDDKVFFVGLNIVVIVAVVVLAWRNGFQESKNQKQPRAPNDAHEEAERRTYA